MEMKAPELSVLPDRKLRLQNPGCILQGAAEKWLSWKLVCHKSGFCRPFKRFPSAQVSEREALS